MAVDTWKSDDKANDLEQLIDEFEKKVNRSPGAAGGRFHRAILRAG